MLGKHLCTQASNFTITYCGLHPNGDEWKEMGLPLCNICTINYKSHLND